MLTNILIGSEIAVTNIEFKNNLKYHTVATDGKNIYVDPKYFASLSENDRIFTLAHQIMHIKFMHMYRLKDKSGVKRDSELWNTATDAIINANLERDGFRIKEGYVNMPEALDYSAEEFYQKLLKEKEEEQKNNKNQEQGEGQEQEQTEEEQANIDFDEKGEFEDNRKEKREKFKSRREKTEKDIRSTDKEEII